MDTNHKFYFCLNAFRTPVKVGGIVPNSYINVIYMSFDISIKYVQSVKMINRHLTIFNHRILLWVFVVQSHFKIAPSVLHISIIANPLSKGRTIAQAVSRWLPTTAVRGSKPDLGMWDLWWDKVALGRFSPSTSVSPAIVVRSTNYSTITLIYHLGKMYNRPICGLCTGANTNLGDLQRDLMGVKSHPTK
jgi:hypothetical protein